jgi:hypothetical protein
VKTIEDKNDIRSWNIPVWNELDVILANKGWNGVKAHIAERLLLDALWLSYQEPDESKALLHTTQHLINEVNHMGHPAGANKRPAVEMTF